ncbi:MAG: hypothetical protein KCHDKBKB_02207 [Elusimicrobia bacterium]|nr:hypothetical protein [Elusimicrobiota bacterium]
MHLRHKPNPPFLGKVMASLAVMTISFSLLSPSQAAPVKKNKTSDAAKVSEKTEAGETKVPGKIESVTRKVEVFRAGSNGWKKAQSSTPLSPADKIKTGTRSVARVKLADGTKILLLQNSQAEVEKLSSVQKSIKLLKGRIRAIVSKMKGGNNFQINTPVGVASVRGTDFEVSVEGDEKSPQMQVSVNEGQVGVSKLGDMSQEVVLNAGESIKFGFEGDMGTPIRSGSLPGDRDTVRTEIQIAKSKEAMLAMAAEESRQADYQTGKSLMDVDGQRVRVEEYIMRPRADQFKLVVLNERPERFDYFTYKGTFNTDLPEDLSIALGQVAGKVGATAPDYYLREYETVASNTVDTVSDSASGGHLVKIDFDGTNYTLTDNEDATNTRVVEAAALQPDGSYKIYNPIRDSFSLVSAANKTEALKVGVVDGGNYRNLTGGDTYWKTRFNTYAMFVNSTGKTAYEKKGSVTNTLAVDLDANFSNAPITSITEFPDGTSQLHNKLSLFYADGSKLVYDNYIIDDEGNMVPASTFNGISTSAEYKNILDTLNYQQNITATEMGSRSIRLVIDPRIGTKSGLIQ